MGGYDDSHGQFNRLRDILAWKVFTYDISFDNTSLPSIISDNELSVSPLSQLNKVLLILFIALVVILVFLGYFCDGYIYRCLTRSRVGARARDSDHRVSIEYKTLLLVQPSYKQIELTSQHSDDLGTDRDFR